jgi:hypothetical protein
VLKANTRALTVTVEQNEQGILLLLCIVTSSELCGAARKENYIRLPL